MERWSAKVLYKADFTLGEGAYWHEEWKCFLYVDIEHGIVGCINPATGAHKEINVGKKIGTVVHTTNNKLIVALQGSIEELDFEKGSQQQLTTIEEDKPFNRCNEGKCDAHGRLWIGTMHVDAKHYAGTLYKYDNALEKVIENVSVSNGICWSKDNKTMYYIDSFDYNIRAYDFDIKNGTVANVRIVVNINTPGHLPDGMCIDTEGMLWVAIWGGGCVNRYNPSTGALIGSVSVNAPNVTSCAFGGQNMQQLFITTAKKGLNEEQLRTYPDSGSLFIVDTPYKGMLPHAFKAPEQFI